MTVSHAYHLAEANRIFKCDSLKGVPGQVESIFRKDLSTMAKPANLHYAFVLNANAKDYGLAGTIENFLSSNVKDHLLDAFNKTDFSVAGGVRKQGLTIDSLRTLEIFASLQDNADVGSSVKPIVTNFINKISKQTIEDGNKFSLFSQFLDEADLGSAALNLNTLKIIKLYNNFEKLTKEQKAGFRNFFVQSAALSSSVAQLLPALNGLKLIGSDIPAVRITADHKKTVSVSEKSKSVKLDIVNSFG